MLHLYGDSHCDNCFKNLKLEHKNFWQSITMYRVGRDNKIINFVDSKNIVLVYGEIDCRTNIGKQINLGRNEDEIIETLITNYFKTIANTSFDKIIIVGIIPPTKQNDYEKIHGPILHKHPFVHSDEDRVRYTKKMNHLLNEYCNKYNYIYFNPFDYYTREDGTLKYEFSDLTVHLGNNTYFLNKFYELYNEIITG